MTRYEAWHAATEEDLTPWCRETVDEDRASLRRIEAARTRAEPPAPADDLARLRSALAVAAPHDPDLFRAFLETRCCVTRFEEVAARPGVAERATEVASALGPAPAMGRPARTCCACSPERRAG